jgi:hypothetical protein
MGVLNSLFHVAQYPPSYVVQDSVAQHVAGAGCWKVETIGDCTPQTLPEPRILVVLSLNPETWRPLGTVLPKPETWRCCPTTDIYPNDST